MHFERPVVIALNRNRHTKNRWGDGLQNTFHIVIGELDHSNCIRIPFAQDFEPSSQCSVDQGMPRSHHCPSRANRQSTTFDSTVIQSKLSYNNPAKQFSMNWYLTERMISEPYALLDRSAETKQLVGRIRPSSLNTNLEKSASDSACILRYKVKVRVESRLPGFPLTDIGLQKNECFGEFVI